MAKGKYEEWLTEDGLLQLEAWARNGLTDQQIAENIGICRDTLIEWKKRFPDISDTLKRGKAIVDIQVENALLKRALGYSYTETTRERVIDYDKTTGIPTGSHMEVTKEVVKEVSPDTTAQIFWLKNRKPDVWRDKRDVGVEGSVQVNTPYDELSVEELKALARKCESDGNT